MKGSIALLTRTQSQIRALAVALESHGVPFTATHSDSFYELPEVNQFRLLFEALFSANPLSVVGVLRSALVGCSDRELLDIGAQFNWRWDGLIDAASVAVGKDSSIGALGKEVQEWWKRMTFLLG